MEEIGARAKLFEFHNFGSQSARFIEWLIKSCSKDGIKPHYIFSKEAIILLAKSLITSKAEDAPVNGDVRDIVTMEALHIFRQMPIPLIDLSDLNIPYYDYQHANRHDDFMFLAERMVVHSPLMGLLRTDKK